MTNTLVLADVRIKLPKSLQITDLIHFEKSTRNALPLHLSGSPVQNPVDRHSLERSPALTMCPGSHVKLHNDWYSLPQDATTPLLGDSSTGHVTTKIIIHFVSCAVKVAKKH